MPLRAVLDTPMKTFWFLSGSVRRLLAEERRDQLEVLVSANHGESAAALFTRLDEEAPQAVTLTTAAQIAATSKPDPGAADTLRALM